MALDEILELFLPVSPQAGLLLVVFSLLCLVQISPIKINPWDTILGWIGSKINAGVKKDLDEVSRQTSIQKEEFREF